MTGAGDTHDLECEDRGAAMLRSQAIEDDGGQDGRRSWPRLFGDREREGLWAGNLAGCWAVGDGDWWRAAEGPYVSHSLFSWDIRHQYYHA